MRFSIPRVTTREVHVSHEEQRVAYLPPIYTSKFDMHPTTTREAYHPTHSTREMVYPTRSTRQKLQLTRYNAIRLADSTCVGQPHAPHA